MAAHPITTITSPYFEKYQLRPYNPAELYRRKGWNVYDDMREDDQISALLHFKKNMMINSGYYLECEDDEIREFIEWNLEDINFPQAMYEILSAFDYGFSLTEIVTGIKKDSEYPGNICIIGLKTRAPHTFEIHQDDSGRVTEIIQYGNKGDIYIKPEKFIHFIHNAEFDNPYGESELNRGVYTAWWSKKAIIKFWNMYLERFGSPLALGKYDSTKVQEEILSDMRTALKNLQANTAMLVPNQIELEFIEATTGSGGFETAIDKYNTMIARKMLVPDLLGLAGTQTQGGSYALGDRQYRLFLQSLEKPRRYLERLINLQLINPLVSLNFNTDAKCKLCFNPMSSEDHIENVKLWLDAVQKGAVTKTPQDENWVRESLGLHEIEEEELKRIKEESMPQIQIPDQEDMPEPDEKPAQEIKQEKTEDTPEKYAFSPIGEYDRKVNYTRVSKTMDEKTTQLKIDLGQVIKDSVNQLVGEIRSKRIIENKKWGVIRELRLKGWDKFRTTLKRGLLSVSDAGWYEAESEIGTRKDNMIEQDLVTVHAEEFIAHITSEIAALKNDEILNAIKQILSNGIQAGQSQQQILANIDESLRGYDTGAPAGSDGVTAPKLETLVRTNVTNAYNQGRWEYFNKAPDMIQGYMYSAILDGRTTSRCSALNGKVFKQSDAAGLIPPLHYNCRSLLVPVTIMEKTPDFAGASEIPKKEGGYFK